MYLQNLTDIDGITIQPGQTIERVIQDRASMKGWRYEVLPYNWHADTPGNTDLIAKNIHQTHLLTPERAKEFRIVM